MKKFLGILAIAGMLVACNNSADSTENSKDSLDSVEKAKKEAVDNNADAQKDAIENKTDAQKDSLNRVDSMRRADSLKK